MDYFIDEQLLIQWFLAGLSQKVRQHISLETFKTYEDALTKALGRDGRRHTYLPHGPQIGTVARECTEVSEGAHPQELGSLVYQVLNKQPLQR